MWRTFFAVIIVGILATIITIYDREASEKKDNQPIVTAAVPLKNSDFEKAVKLFQKGDFEKLFALLELHEEDFTYHSREGRLWVDLFIAVATSTKDAATLALLYQDFPQAFGKNEEASLLLGNYFLTHHDNAEYYRLRHPWGDKITQEQAWLLLDVDALLIDKRQAEAIKLLESCIFPGADDCSRLIRLALLTIKKDPQSAWNYLAEAEVKDPSSSDVHLYRASLLESLDKYSEAEEEHLLAVQKDPQNFFLRDQLAEFFLRHKQSSKALATWEAVLSENPVDSIFIKALFWDRLVGKGDLNLDSQKIASSKYQPFIAYLQNLPQGHYWNEEAFMQIPNGAALLQREPYLFWLRLLDQLETGEKAQALRLLDANQITIVPSQFPAWVAVDIARALNEQRGHDEALIFAVLQDPSEELSNLIDRLLKATKDNDQALSKIKNIALEPTEKGSKFSWLMAHIFIEKEDFDSARQALNQQPLMWGSLLGKELMARIELLDGNESLANELYLEIVESSSEAKSFLARKAFQDRNWSRARELTQELLNDHPDNPILLDNLRKIAQEAASSSN